MPGVTHIQMQAVLHFDDGFTITLSSPVLKKDIRHGDYFQDAQIAEVFVGCGAHMAQLIEEKTAIKIHDEIKGRKDFDNLPRYWRKPRYGEPPSNN